MTRTPVRGGLLELSSGYAAALGHLTRVVGPPVVQVHRSVAGQLRPAARRTFEAAYVNVRVRALHVLDAAAQTLDGWAERVDPADVGPVLRGDAPRPVTDVPLPPDDLDAWLATPLPEPGDTDEPF